MAHSSVSLLLQALLLLLLLSLSSAFSSITPTNSTGTDGSSTDGSSIDDDATAVASAEINSQFLDAHNAARRAVGVGPLTWEPILATYARVYGGQRRKDCNLVHSPGYGFGENIFWGQGRRWTATDIMAAWLAERQWYRYNTNTCAGPDCTHYTQIVWRTTARVGCAKIVCDSRDSFAVCEYYPPGNYIGARPYLDPMA